MINHDGNADDDKDDGKYIIKDVKESFCSTLLTQPDVDINFTDKDGRTLLHSAARESQLGLGLLLPIKPGEEATKLVWQKDNHGNTAVSEAEQATYDGLEEYTDLLRRAFPYRRPEAREVDGVKVKEHQEPRQDK